MAEATYTPSTKAEAISVGSDRYYTGLPCRRGHFSFRYLADQGCLDCRRVRKEAHRQRIAACPLRTEARREKFRRDKAEERNSPDGKRRHYEANKRYVEANREKVNSYYRARRKQSPDFAMASRSRSMLHKVLDRTNQRKDATCVTLVGYDGKALRLHIERQFTKGMTWANYGEWHVDHIVPVAEFLRRGVADPAVINALTNLQPLWALENIRKSDAVSTLL